MDPITTTAVAGWSARIWKAVGGSIIGNILRPGQIRREGMAAIDVKVQERLALAQADLYVKEMQEGKKTYSLQQLRLISHDTSRSFPAMAEPLTNDAHDAVSPTDILSVVAADRLKKEINVARAALYAEESIGSEAAPPPTATPSDDWLTRWRESVEGVSEDEMQELWGRILAGELKEPGSFSLRALDALRNLSKEDADLVTKAANLRIHDFIFRPEEKAILDERGLFYSQFLELQDLGILAGVEALGLEKTLRTKLDQPFKMEIALNDHVMRITSEDLNNELKIPIYKFTKLGMQIAGLAKSKDDLTYLAAVAEAIRKQGFEISFHEIAMRDGKSVTHYKTSAIALPVI